MPILLLISFQNLRTPLSRLALSDSNSFLPNCEPPCPLRVSTSISTRSSTFSCLTFTTGDALGGNTTPDGGEDSGTSDGDRAFCDPYPASVGLSTDPPRNVDCVNKGLGRSSGDNSAPDCADGCLDTGAADGLPTDGTLGTTGDVGASDPCRDNADGATDGLDKAACAGGIVRTRPPLRSRSAISSRISLRAGIQSIPALTLACAQSAESSSTWVAYIHLSVRPF